MKLSFRVKPLFVSKRALKAAMAATAIACLAVACSKSTMQPSGPPITSVSANFTVTSLSPAFRKDQAAPVLPAGTVDACPLINSSNPVLDCQFDGAASTATLSSPIAAYVWTWSFGTQQRTDTSSSPQFKPTVSGCGFFGGQGSQTTSGVQFIGMKVDLKIKDASGNESPVKSNQNVRIFPAGLCGYAF